MNIKKFMFLVALTLGTKVYADVADEILKYTNVVSTLCKPFAPSKDPNKRGNRERCELLVGVGKDAYRISKNVETFKDKSLAIVSKKGDELLALLKCMDKGGMATETCKNLKCTTESDCIALILKTTKELLEPVVKDLIASASAPGKYDNGALFNLANLSFLPKPKADEQSFGQKMAFKVVNFADNVNGALDFMNALSLVLSPKAFIAATPELTPAEKEKLAQVEPIVLPADTQINPEQEINLDNY